MDRRHFLKTSLLSTTALVPVSHGTTSYISTEAIEVTHLGLQYKSIHPDLSGLKIGFISDIHLGGWVRNEFIANAVSLMQKESVDIVLHGGDFIWVPDSLSIHLANSFINDSFRGASDEEIAESIFAKIQDLISPLKPPLGSFGVLGNHDRWSNDHAVFSYLPKSGVELLINKEVVISRGKGKIRLYGSADYWTGVPIPPTFQNDNTDLRILLTHNPDFASYCYHLKKIPFHLSLSGHTHGGQIKLPLLGAVTYNIEDSRYGEGLVDYGETKIFTSRGLGVVEVPLRIMCPPEITVFTITR